MGKNVSVTHISTPCTNVCVVDEASGLCMGCGRTLDEIARWASLSEGERRRIMAGLDGRRSEAAPAAEREKA